MRRACATSAGRQATIARMFVPRSLFSRGRAQIAAAISTLAPPVSRPAHQRSAALAEAMPTPGRAVVERIDAADGLAGLSAHSVDLVCTSPPYWGLRTYDQEHDDQVLCAWQQHNGDGRACPPYDWYRRHGGVLGLEPYPDWYVAHLVEVFAAARTALKPDANLWINLGDTYFGRWSSIRPNGRQGLGADGRQRRRTPSGGWLHDKQMLMIPARFAIAMQEAGWILRNDLIWAKPHVAPRPERDRLRLSHEHFFHFVQRTKGGRPSYFYELDEVEERALDVVSVQPRSVGNGHPATFPHELIQPRIASSCPPNGTVCDPFCGSGTTLTAAVSLGRAAIGFDVSATYVALTARYLADMDAVHMTAVA